MCSAQATESLSLLQHPDLTQTTSPAHFAQGWQSNHLASSHHVSDSNHAHSLYEASLVHPTSRYLLRSPSHPYVNSIPPVHFVRIIQPAHFVRIIPPAHFVPIILSGLHKSPPISCPIHAMAFSATSLHSALNISIRDAHSLREIASNIVQ